VREFAEWLQATSLSQTFQAVDWIIPLLQSIHIVTIGVVFVSSLMICLRVLGRMRVDEAFGAVWERFAPWMWRGLIVMVVTGLLLIVGEPVREFMTLSFWLKMALLAIVVVGTALFGRAFRPGSSTGHSAAAAVAGAGAQLSGAANPVLATAASPEFSAGAKAAVVGFIVLWLAVIFLGRAIAYDVEVWGSLSLHAPQ
jgi:hypothetical protein